MADDAAVDDLDWEALALSLPAAGVPDDAGDIGEERLAVRPGPRKGFGWKVWLPTPRRRDRTQHIAAAARMREAKALKRSGQQSELVVSQVNAALQSFRTAGILFDHGLRLQKKHRGGIMVVLPCEGKRKRVPIVTMLRAAYSLVNSKADVARMHRISTKTVARIRMVVAQCCMESDAAFMNGLAASFAAGPAPQV
jgi:hypothetical protein